MNLRPRQESGLGVVGIMVLVPVLLIAAAVAWYAYCEARKAYWDKQVTQMCEKDGGATVFEAIALTADQRNGMLDSFGALVIPTANQIKPGSVVFSEKEEVYLNEAFPQVRRSEFRIKRLSDKKLLAKQIIYSRVGGDFPSPAHDSSFSCLDLDSPHKRYDVEKLTILFQER